MANHPLNPAPAASHLTKPLSVHIPPPGAPLQVGGSASEPEKHLASADLRQAAYFPTYCDLNAIR